MPRAHGHLHDEAQTEQHTVKVLMREDQKVFLVAERGTPEEPSRFGGTGKRWRKRPGLGLPGGKVEGSVLDILDGIRQELRFRRISEEPHALMFKRLRRHPHPRIVLTAVKEVLEETGMLVMPFALQQWSAAPDKDTVWLCQAKVVGHGDTTRGGDAKIIEAAWHPADRLPEQTYRRTREMVRRSLTGGTT